jgi:hypothetical protein
MFLGSKAHPMRRADNHGAICEPTVQQYGILIISQLYRPWRTVKVTALFFLLIFYLRKLFNS